MTDAPKTVLDKLAPFQPNRLAEGLSSPQLATLQLPPNKLGGEPALARWNAGLAGRPLLGLALLDPEIPEADRKAVAWANLPGSPTDHFKTSESGRRICWADHGDRNSRWGWEIDHRMPLALGGRHTRSNLIARHWEDNARAGGLLGALLQHR
jgi:hypothetical protein